MRFEIEAYSFGQIVIDGKTYKKDLIICPKTIVENWWRKEGHSLYPEDLEAIMNHHPEQLIIGTGDPGRLTVPDSTKNWLSARGIDLTSMPTKQACEYYTSLDDISGMVMGLHLTC